jgi:hypothetical protein
MSPAFDAADGWPLALMGFAATGPNHRIALVARLTVQRVLRLWRSCAFSHIIACVTLPIAVRPSVAVQADVGL